jgi:hypothetical protein
LAARQQLERLLKQIVEIRQWMAQLAEDRKKKSPHVNDASRDGERVKE